MSQRIPLAFICCGSFNPITNMHLRMFGNNLNSKHKEINLDELHNYFFLTLKKSPKITSKATRNTKLLPVLCHQ